MKPLDITLYSPSDTWNEFLHKLLWRQDTIIESACWAFREAIRRGMSRSDVCFEVAERIHRSYCPVNWGLLNYLWKQVLGQENGGTGDNSTPRTPESSPVRPSPQPPITAANHNSRTQVGNWNRHPNGNHAPTGQQNGGGHHNGHHHGNGDYRSNHRARQQQRQASSLISYYA